MPGALLGIFLSMFLFVLTMTSYGTEDAGALLTTGDHVPPGQELGASQYLDLLLLFYNYLQVCEANPLTPQKGRNINKRGIS